MNVPKYKFYIVYKITNTINNKIYVGAHRTNIINDGYMGSGKNIIDAYNHYEINNFEKEILFLFNNEKDMFLKEKEIVNKEFLEREDVYNIAIGGCGDWTHCTEKRQELYAENPVLLKQCNNKISVAGKANFASGKVTTNESLVTWWNGKKHSDSTKCKMSIAAKERLEIYNPIRGRVWIHNLDLKKSLMVKEIDLVEFFAAGWRIGRKIKFI